MDDERLYTIPEAATKLRVKRDAIYKWIREGRLDYVVVGSQRRITSSAIDAFIKASTEAEKARLADSGTIEELPMQSPSRAAALRLA